MRQPTVMRRAHCRPAQQIDSDVVVAPDLHDATCQVEQPLLNLRMGTVERVHRAAPRFTGVADDWTRGIAQQPVGVGRGESGAFGHGEGREPEPRLEPLGVDLVGEPPVAVRKPLVRLPRPDCALVAVVELDIAEKSAVEARGAELHVGDHVRLPHGARELGPRAPSSGSDRLPQALLIDAGRRHEQGGEGLQAVSIRVEAQMHARRVAFGSQGPGRAPVADRLEALRRELDARLAWLSSVERDGQTPAASGEPERAVAFDVARLGSTDGDHAARIARGRPVDQRFERAVSGQRLGVRHLEEPNRCDGREKAVGEERHRDRRQHSIGAREELRFHPHAGRPAAHHHGVSARGTAVSHRTIFQFREGDGLVADPRDDIGPADERNG